MIAFGVSAWAWGMDAASLQRAGDLADDPHALLELPPAERRRLNPLTVLVLRAAEVLLQNRPRELLRNTPLVLGSADGDGAVLLKLMRALGDHQPLSPTQFHNSVNNAPAGYWSIGLSSTTSTTAIAAGVDTLEVALAEAGMLALATGAPTLMVCATLAFPDELAVMRPDSAPLAVAAWCMPSPTACAWRCALAPAAAQAGARDLATLSQAFADQGLASLPYARAVPRLGAELRIEVQP